MVVAGQKLIFLNPRVEPSLEAASVAPRLDMLQGKVVGLLDNSKAAGRVILDDLGVLLRERCGVREVVNAGKPTFGRIASDAVVDYLVARCDVVFTAIGD